MAKPYFEPVEPKPNFPEMEKGLLSEWYKKGVVKKYLSKNKNSKKYFSFLDGPITANNPMGVHHAWGRTYKDLWQRFKNMRGFRQRFQNGFDCQGLWVEVEVEKELGFKSKKDVEKFGVAKFVQLCRDRVKKYSGIQTEQTKRLGNFMDWDHSYYTLSDDNNYMIWHFLKKCHEAGWLYKGNDSVAWCPRCETAISQHEMLTEDYKEVTHESVYLAFPIVGRKNEYLLAWTTTPWTVPANIAVAVDKDLTYGLVESFNGHRYWVFIDEKNEVLQNWELLHKISGDPKHLEILDFKKGSELVGLKYTGAFDGLPAVKKAREENPDKFHTVVAADPLILPVTTTEGTGLVHTAVSAGSEDFRLGKKLGLPMILVIKDDASYMEGLGNLSGQNAKKDPRIILDYLEKLETEEKHFFFKIENYRHRYPACWRCKTELVWKVTDEWYIAMDSPSRSKLKSQSSKLTLRKRMMTVAKKINWLPDFGLDRELDWLKNMHDWLISKKNRYWGLALPIWECTKCGNFEVIGSKEELKQKAVEGWDKFEGKSPHKPQIDAIKIKCSNCGTTSSRVEPVGNPWLDAGIVPFSTISSDNTDPLYLKDRKEWLKWFPADFITESFPGQFKNWFYSLIAMSTVLQGSEPFKTVLGFATMVDQMGRGFHKSLGNAIEFVEGADKAGADVIRWMCVRQNPAENLQFGYELADETRRKFHLKVWNIYNFFVTYANLDGWSPIRRETIESIKYQASILDKWILARLKETLKEVAQSLEKYDGYAASGSIETFVDDLSLWYIRRSRNRVGPAAESEIDKKAFYDTSYLLLVTLSRLLAPFTPFISEIIYRNLTKEESVHLSDWPAGKPLSDEDREILKEMQGVRMVVEKAHSERKELGIVVRQPLNSLATTYPKPLVGLENLVKDEVNVRGVNWGKLKGNELLVKLDTKITPELAEEAKVRDLIRKIQEERKNMGMNLTQKIEISNPWTPKEKKLVDWIIRKTAATKLSQGEFKVVRAS